jgi:hypothetical protein
MSLLSDIREQLANLKQGNFTAIRGLKGPNKAWICWKEGGKIFAFVPAKHRKVAFEEEFSSVQIRTAQEDFTGRRQHGIVVECKHRLGTRSIFASLCEDFVRPENRALVTTDPGAWCEPWRVSLGNSLRKRNPCEVIAELLVLCELQKAGLAPCWEGPAKKNHDIVCPDFDVEVKSSTVRSARIITLSSENQLKAHANRPLFIAFCRFEQHPKGQHSIETAKKSLIRAGYDESKIEEGLAACGYTPGNRDRARRYNLLEDTTQYYSVDDGFPRITPESFVGGAVPQGILPNIEYRVDLSDKQLKIRDLSKVLQEVARQKQSGKKRRL